MTKQRDEQEDVMALLSVLEPGAGEQAMPASQALAQLKKQATISQNSGWHPAKMLKEFIMNINRKRLLAPVMALLLIGVFVLSPAMRAAANDFLGLFRVQKFAAISVSPDQIAMLEELADSGITPGEFEMIDEPGEPQKVGSLAEAGISVGFDVQSPADLGVPSEVAVAEGGAGKLTINVESSRAILEMVGADPSVLPDSLDGQEVSVTVFPGVMQEWERGYSLMQMPSPEVFYPDDVDPAVMGEALLKVLGMDDAKAARLARSIDWTTTLLLPIPQGTAEFDEVTVNGVSGLALTEFGGSGGAIIWQKDGIIYGLTSDFGSQRELLRVANSMN